MMEKKNQSYLYNTHELVSSPPLTELNPRYLPVLLLGFKNVYDNFLLIWNMQNLLHENVEQYQKQVEESVLATLVHRPKIKTFYLLSCFTIAKEFNRPEACDTILATGHEVFPNDWQLLMVQGFIHAFLLNNPGQAAAYYSRAANINTSPPYVARVAKKLLQRKKLTPEDLQKSLSLLPDKLKNSFLKALSTEKKRPGHHEP